MPLQKRGSVRIKLDITRVYHDLITSIVAALEEKDRFTADHSLRVSDMAERICRFVGLPDEQTEIIHMAAHVHDIGKISVPDSILVKPGPLDEKEWSKIRRHPRAGADILRKHAGLNEIADIVLHHHERWDGKGYPDGLKGCDIPLGSRIIAICDSIDAMTSERPYRETLSHEACREEIRRNRGLMYDPKIVDVVLREWDDVVTPGCPYAMR